MQYVMICFEMIVRTQQAMLGSDQQPARATICLMIFICFQKRLTALIRYRPHTRYLFIGPFPIHPRVRIGTYQKWSSPSESFYAAILSTRVLVDDSSILSPPYVRSILTDTRMHASIQNPVSIHYRIQSRTACKCVRIRRKYRFQRF